MLSLCYINFEVISTKVQILNKKIMLVSSTRYEIINFYIQILALRVHLFVIT